jgi:hypothetical protein
VLPADTPDKALTNAAWRIKGLRHKAGYSQEDVDYKLQPPTGVGGKPILQNEPNKSFILNEPVRQIRQLHLLLLQR